MDSATPRQHIDIARNLYLIALLSIPEIENDAHRSRSNDKGESGVGIPCKLTVRNVVSFFFSLRISQEMISKIAQNFFAGFESPM